MNKCREDVERIDALLGDQYRGKHKVAFVVLSDDESGNNCVGVMSSGTLMNVISTVAGALSATIVQSAGNEYTAKMVMIMFCQKMMEETDAKLLHFQPSDLSITVDEIPDELLGGLYNE